MARKKHEGGPGGRLPEMERIRARQNRRREENNAQTDIQTDLQNLQQSCRAALSESARISQYLANKELVEAGNTESINRHATILANDMVKFRDELLEIEKDTEGVQLDPENPEDIAKGLEIGERYQDWHDRFMRTVGPIAEKLSELLIDAARKLEAQQTTEESADHDE